MLRFLRLTAISSIALLVLFAGCSAPKQPQATSPSPTPSLSTEPAPSPVISTAPSPSSKADLFQDASDKAISATTISQSALSKDDWNLVASTWQESIDLMKGVPTSSSNYVLAQKKVSEYQQNLAYAKQQAAKLTSSLELTVAQKSSEFEPVQPQEVTAEQFMKIYFEEVVDQGRDGTADWCTEYEILASSLFSPRSWEILDVFNYSEDRVSITARIESSNKGGSPIIKNWRFSLSKGETLLQKQMRQNGSIEAYKYSKAEKGGWCIVSITD